MPPALAPVGDEGLAAQTLQAEALAKTFEDQPPAALEDTSGTGGGVGPDRVAVAEGGGDTGGGDLPTGGKDPQPSAPPQPSGQEQQAAATDDAGTPGEQVAAGQDEPDQARQDELLGGASACADGPCSNEPLEPGASIVAAAGGRSARDALVRLAERLGLGRQQPTSPEESTQPGDPADLDQQIDQLKTRIDFHRYDIVYGRARELRPILGDLDRLQRIAPPEAGTPQAERLAGLRDEMEVLQGREPTSSGRSAAGSGANLSELDPHIDSLEGRINLTRLELARGRGLTQTLRELGFLQSMALPGTGTPQAERLADLRGQLQVLQGQERTSFSSSTPGSSADLTDLNGPIDHLKGFIDLNRWDLARGRGMTQTLRDLHVLQSMAPPETPQGDRLADLQGQLQVLQGQERTSFSRGTPGSSADLSHLDPQIDQLAGGIEGNRRQLARGRGMRETLQTLDFLRSMAPPGTPQGDRLVELRREVRELGAQSRSVSVENPTMVGGVPPSEAQAPSKAQAGAGFGAGQGEGQLAVGMPGLRALTDEEKKQLTSTPGLRALTDKEKERFASTPGRTVTPPEAVGGGELASVITELASSRAVGGGLAAILAAMLVLGCRGTCSNSMLRPALGGFPGTPGIPSHLQG
jgi:hypothetical protein